MREAREVRARRAPGPGLAALAVVALLAVPPPAAPAPLYRWTDASGAVVYADQPPPHPPPHGVEIILDAVPTYAHPAMRPAFEPPAEGSEASPAYKGAPSPPPKEHYSCAQAKSYLAIHSQPSGDRRTLYEPGPDGTFKALSTTDVAGMREAWQAVVDRVCAGGAASPGGAGEGGAGTGAAPAGGVPAPGG